MYGKERNLRPYLGSLFTKTEETRGNTEDFLYPRFQIYYLPNVRQKYHCSRPARLEGDG